MGQDNTHRFRQFVRSCIVRPLRFLNAVGSSIETWSDWIDPETRATRPIHKRYDDADVRELNSFMLERYPQVMFVCSYNAPRAAITALTPGNGTDSDWQRMYTACGRLGEEAQRQLISELSSPCDSDSTCA